MTAPTGWKACPTPLSRPNRPLRPSPAARPPAGEVPWFWSDQYDVKLQIAGVPFEADDILVRGDPASRQVRRLPSEGRHGGQAVEAVNAPPEFMAGKQLIASRRAVAREKLADPAISMKEVAA